MIDTYEFKIIFNAWYYIKYVCSEKLLECFKHKVIYQKRNGKQFFLIRLNYNIKLSIDFNTHKKNKRVKTYSIMHFYRVFFFENHNCIKQHICTMSLKHLKTISWISGKLHMKGDISMLTAFFKKPRLIT